MFRVRVPSDWGQKELIWTLTTRGKTEKAYATLRPDYFVDDVVIASETGALGAGTSSPEIRANKRPSVKLDGEKTRTAKVGQPVTLSRTPSRMVARPPEFGEQTEEVLEEFGLDVDEITALKKAKVV